MKIYKLVIIELWHRKSQLISGLLAITLGIGVIVGIRSVAVVSEKAVAVNLDNLGANILVLPQGTSIDNYYSADIDAPTFPEDYVEKIRTSTISGVDNISPKLTRRIKVNNQNVVLTGILPSNEIAAKPTWQSSSLSGQELQASCAPTNDANKSSGYEDEKLKRKPIESLQQNDCIIGSNIAKTLNLKQGHKVNILGSSFNVFNVLGETGTIDDDRIFAHLHAVQKLTGIENQVSVIEIMGCCNAISDGLLGKLRNILPDTKITTINQIVSTQIKTNQLMNKISIIFLIIILFVGGISIGNSIWANVNERKKELGTLRMIGFTKGKIYEMLLLKAAILGILGGIFGYIIGTLSGVVLGPQLAGLNIEPIPIYLLWSVIISLIISLLGALIPAYIAGKIEPYKIMQEA
jgi:putative ABC transport system permease protein